MAVPPFRSQGPMFWILGMLLGIVLVGILLTHEGLPAPLAARFANLVSPPQSSLPATIELGGAGSAQGGTAGVPPTSGASGSAQSVGTPPPAPTLSTMPSGTPAGGVTVVPAPVYQYPADDHGDGHGGDGEGHH
jgi:hypothetical protein